MIKVTEETLKSNIKGISVRLPEDFHAVIKGEAYLNHMTKDKFMLSLLQRGIEVYNGGKIKWD